MTANQINYWNLQETKRHNVRTEDETERHNRMGESIDLSKLSETERHNRATEGIDLGKLDVERFKAAETKRHNQATEGLTGYDLSIQQGIADEAHRHNTASESLQNFTNLTDAQYKYNLNELNTLKGQFQQLENDWYSQKTSTGVQLSQSQINKVEAEIAKIKQEIQLAPKQLTNQQIQSIGSLLRGLSGMIPKG